SEVVYLFSARGRVERLQYLLGTRAGSFTRSLWLGLGDSFIQGNVTSAQMARLDRVASEHGIARHVNANTVGLTWERFQMVEAEVRRRDKWVYGVLENTAESFASAEALKAMLDEQELGLVRK